MTCEQYQEQASALLDQELGDNEAGETFLHLSGCASCRRSLQTMLAVRDGLQEESSPTVSADMDRAILRAVREFRPDRAPTPLTLSRRRVSIPVPVVAAASVLLVVASLVVSMVWAASGLSGDNAKVQTVFLTTLPTVEIRAYDLKPVSAIQ